MADTLYCVTCAEPFALSNEAGFRHTGITFYCPRGHAQHFPGEVNRLQLRVKELEDEVARQKETKDRYWSNWHSEVGAAQRKIASLRGVITRMKKK